MDHAIEEILSARQKRDELLHDTLLSAREAIRVELRPDTPAEIRQIYEKVNVALHLLRGDPFDFHIRAALSVQEERTSLLESAVKIAKRNIEERADPCGEPYNTLCRVLEGR